MKDCIVVLGGGINEDGTLPDTPQLRVRKAVELFNKGIAPYIVMSTKWSCLNDFVPPRTEACAMKEFAVSLGVSSDKILLEEESLDTLGNIYFTKKLVLEPKGWTNIVIVTSEYHIERSSYLAHKILGPLYTIEMVSCKAGKVYGALPHDPHTQDRVLKLSKFLLDSIEDGDDAAVKEVMYTKHPAYIKDHPHVKKAILEMLKHL